MKIFHRYMALRFLKPFLFGLGMFALLIFLGDLFDKMPKLVRSPAPIWVIFNFLWLDVPYWTVRVVPMASLLATLFAVTSLLSSGEWAAVQAAGFETRAFLRPVLYMAALVTAASFIAQETVLPYCYSRAQLLWHERIHPEWEWHLFNNVTLTSSRGEFITVRVFLPKEGRMERPVMDYYVGGVLSRQLDAHAAVWDPAIKRWIFLNGVERVFGPAGPTETKYERRVSELDAPPLQLVPRRKSPDEMSLWETVRYLRQVRYLGTSPREAATALQSKLSYPFANFIVCLLGIPIALRLRRAPKAGSIAVALAVSFFYLWTMEMGKALGNAGRAAPWVAAWAPHLLFGAAAFWLYRRTEI